MTTANPLPDLQVQQLFPSMQPRAPPPAVAAVADRSVLRRYYAESFPFDALANLLQHCEPEAFPLAHREFSMTKRDPGADEFYMRHRSADSANALRAEILRHVPVKFDIGAVYTLPVRRHTAAGYKPVLRELVFDVDVSDYERDCCADAKQICSRCWAFAQCAVEVLDHLLRRRLGLELVLWVFSGRRGVHCWVWDRDVAANGQSVRSTVLGFVKSPDFTSDRHVVARCRHWFRVYHRRWPRSNDEALADMLPRVDEPVTRGMNHLLKAPFCAHPATGRICVPFDAAGVAEFRPEQAPLVADVVAKQPAAVAALGRAVGVVRGVLGKLGEMNVD